LEQSTGIQEAAEAVHITRESIDKVECMLRFENQYQLGYVFVNIFIKIIKQIIAIFTAQ